VPPDAAGRRLGIDFVRFCGSRRVIGFRREPHRPVAISVGFARLYRGRGGGCPRLRVVGPGAEPLSAFSVHVVVVAVIGCLRGLCRRGSGRGTSDQRQQDQKRSERAASVRNHHIDAIMTLDLADDEARALVPLLRRAIDTGRSLSE
jgi:hypothetical protein